jgi:hypothetical protein
MTMHDGPFTARWPTPGDLELEVCGMSSIVAVTCKGTMHDQVEGLDAGSCAGVMMWLESCL